MSDGLGQSIDDLISDLYPSSRPQQQSGSRDAKDEDWDAPSDGRAPLQRHGGLDNFDDSDDERGGAPTAPFSSKGITVDNRRHHVAFPVSQAPIYARLTNKPLQCCGGGGINACFLSQRQNPCISVASSPSSVTNGNGSQYSVPSLLQLRYPPPKATTPGPQAQRSAMVVPYAAFHIYAPPLGNGVKDYVGGEDVAGGVDGGCPFLVCMKCDHPVVRLQGGRWVGTPPSSCSSNVNDREEINAVPHRQYKGCVQRDPDLYLTVRNLYPDWGRLAQCKLRDFSSAAATTSVATKMPKSRSVADDFDEDEGVGGHRVPDKSGATAVHAFDDDDDWDAPSPSSPQPPRVGHTQQTTTAPVMDRQVDATSSSEEEDPTNPFVLVEDDHAAAYCCQCSWFSVIIAASSPANNSTTSSQTRVETTFTDITLKKHAPEFTSPTGGFITVSLNGCIPDALSQQLNPKGRTRPPLWVCKGHLH